MKKLLALMLALLMCFGCVNVFAETEEEESYPVSLMLTPLFCSDMDEVLSTEGGRAVLASCIMLDFALGNDGYIELFDYEMEEDVLLGKMESGVIVMAFINEDSTATFFFREGLDEAEVLLERDSGGTFGVLMCEEIISQMCGTCYRVPADSFELATEMLVEFMMEVLEE